MFTFRKKAGQLYEGKSAKIRVIRPIRVAINSTREKIRVQSVKSVFNYSTRGEIGSIENK